MFGGKFLVESFGGNAIFDIIEPPAIEKYTKPISFCLCPLLHLGVLYLPSFCDDVDDYDMGDDIGWL